MARHDDVPPTSQEPPTEPPIDPASRRRFLRLAGAGVAATGITALAPRPASASTPPFALNLKDDFGAVGDGVTDDAPAIQAAFTALGSTPGNLGAPQGITGAYLDVPPGDYLLKSTVRIHRFAGVVQGAGIGNGPMVIGSLHRGLGSVFRWDGVAGIPMFEVTDSAHVQFNDLRFFGHDTKVPRAGIRFLKDNVGQNQGTNGHLMVNDCHFGTWPWSTASNLGLMTNGIEFSGTIGDNDQFRIARTVFRGKEATATVGFKVEYTQSIWGTLHDCTFDSLGIGFQTPASTTLVNAQFNRCGTDMKIGSTARINVVGWQSENSGCLATLEPWSTLSCTGGVCRITESKMPSGTPLINAYPSSDAQTISLRDMFIDFPPGTYAAVPRPNIRFGPQNSGWATTSGFSVDIDNCQGLNPDQCTLVTPMAGANSRGTVTWRSRSNKIHQFRNELRGTGAAGTRATVNIAAWDPPIPGSS